MLMLLPSLPGQGWENLRLLTIGSDGWLPSIIVLRSWFLAGLSIGRAPGERLRPQMNFLMSLLRGLEIQIQGSERRGRRVKDWRNSSRFAGLCLFWMAWSRSRIPLVHEKGGYENLPCRRFCASLQPST